MKLEIPGLISPVYAHLPFVTVIVPCLNEEKYISRCLESILANDYPKERMEVLVVDALSEDKTREIVKGYVEQYPLIRLVDNPEKHIPVALNLGIRNARGDTIIKMDAHSTYQPDHISLCVGYQEKYGAENVGGVWKMMPGADTAVARAIVLGLGHRFGSGNAAVKIGVTKPTWSDTAAFGCFKKGLFSRVGFFDERLFSSEDLDMNMRIRAAGGRILLVPQIVINYYADPDLRAFWKHNFADGVWATYVLKFGSKGWAWRHWAPMAFVLSILVLTALAMVHPASLSAVVVVLGMYLSANLAVSVRIAHREKNWKFGLLLPLVFGIRHLAHGLGALFGLVLAVLPGDGWPSGRGPRMPRKSQMAANAVPGRKLDGFTEHLGLVTTAKIPVLSRVFEQKGGLPLFVSRSCAFVLYLRGQNEGEYVHRDLSQAALNAEVGERLRTESDPDRFIGEFRA